MLSLSLVKHNRIPQISELNHFKSNAHMDVSLNSQPARTSVSPAYLFSAPSRFRQLIACGDRMQKYEFSPLIHAVLSVNK